jgi:DNA-binding MltR family transcriptional regulator
MADTFTRVVDELREESDRGCAVMAFAWIDEQVTANLRRFLLPSSHPAQKSDELLGAGKPLGDAATKIDLSLRLGLMREATYKTLTLFRRLRNDFAHLSTSLSFETPSVRDRVLAIFDCEQTMLNAVWESVIADPEAAAAATAQRGKSGPQILRDILGTKRLFCILAGAIVAGLVLSGEDIDPIAPLVANSEA